MGTPAKGLCPRHPIQYLGILAQEDDHDDHLLHCYAPADLGHLCPSPARHTCMMTHQEVAAEEVLPDNMHHYTALHAPQADQPPLTQSALAPTALELQHHHAYEEPQSPSHKPRGRNCDIHRLFLPTQGPAIRSPSSASCFPIPMPARGAGSPHPQRPLPVHPCERASPQLPALPSQPSGFPRQSY
eukprot:4007319-Amphidinium_carterae.2